MLVERPHEEGKLVLVIFIQTKFKFYYLSTGVQSVEQPRYHFTNNYYLFATDLARDLTLSWYFLRRSINFWHLDPVVLVY